MLNKVLYFLKGKPRFCGVCGEELEYDCESVKWNRRTGEPTVERVSFKCPEKRWFLTVFGWEPNNHDYYRWNRRLFAEMEER